MRPSSFAVTATVAAAAVVNVPTFSSAFSLRPSPSFFHSTSLPLKTTTTTSSTSTTTRLFSSASSPDLLQVSRIKTLQNLLSLYGAPGSSTCNQANDLIPVSSDEEDIQDLHPHLFPISKSKSSGNYICALMMNTNDDDDNIKKNQPMAIVESGSGKPGMKLLSLNSEQMMRRIAAEADDSSDLDGTEIVQIYNEGLGQGKLLDSAFDTQYEIGSVAKLGYGPSKYTLLRIGPFPDLYQEMSQNHLSERNDESSALIAAESANGKFGGFGQPYASYAQLLNTLEKREDECRDAARVCLRLPLWTCAMTFEELANISYLAGLTTKDDDEVIEDDTTFKISKMKEMYEKIKTQNEQQESTAGESKTEEQIYLDEATYLMDNTILSSGIAEEKDDKYCKWDDIREQLSDLYKKAGKTDMADFVLKKK